MNRFKAEMSTHFQVWWLVFQGDVDVLFLAKLIGCCYVAVIRIDDYYFSSQKSYLWLRIFWAGSIQDHIHNVNHSMLWSSNWNDIPCPKENIFYPCRSNCTSRFPTDLFAVLICIIWMTVTNMKMFGFISCFLGFASQKPGPSALTSRCSQCTLAYII